MTHAAPRVNAPFHYQLPAPQPRAARMPRAECMPAALPRWMRAVVPEEPDCGAPVEAAATPEPVAAGDSAVRAPGSACAVAPLPC